MSPLSAAPAIDLARSHAVLERAVADPKIFNADQARNVRSKAVDLLEARTRWESVPFRVMIEANRRCNVKCAHCDIERRGTGELPERVIEALLDEIGWGTLEIMPFVGSEPTLAPIELFARLARRYHNHLVFTTNGLLFTRDYFAAIADVTARVHFSLHSHRPDVHARIMPHAPFATIVKNLADAVTIAQETQAQVAAGLTVMDSNVEELPAYVRFVGELGVRRVIFQKLYPWTKDRALLVSEATRSREELGAIYAEVLEAADELGIFVETNIDEIFLDPRNQPSRAPRSPFDVLLDSAEIVALFRPGFCISTAITVLIEWDGTVVPCCRDHIALGNLHRERFGELWNGSVMQELRGTFFEELLRPFCKQCMAFYCGHS